MKPVIEFDYRRSIDYVGISSSLPQETPGFYGCQVYSLSDAKSSKRALLKTYLKSRTLSTGHKLMFGSTGWEEL
jgi:hypothetical protein